MGYLSDEVGEEYKKWTRWNSIYIYSQTGSGKTYFILNYLLPFAAEKGQKILYLVNRKILKEQIEEDLNKISIEKSCYITIETYQTIERRICQLCNNNGIYVAMGCDNYILKEYAKYAYVVCDECHYFFEDANFNTYTSLSFDWIQGTFKNKIRIFISATIADVKKLVKEYDEEEKRKG